MYGKQSLIVAEEFDNKLMIAVAQANNVKFIKYKTNFDFESA